MGSRISHHVGGGSIFLAGEVSQCGIPGGFHQLPARTGTRRSRTICPDSEIRRFGRHLPQFPGEERRCLGRHIPQCGTTWTQEMVWMITHDCDLEAAKEKLQVRSPFIEWPTLPQTDSPVLMDFQKIEAMPSPRVLKSHLPFYLLPPRLADTCKVVYVARNPKDVIVSYFHHHQIVSVQNFTSDIEKFAEYFMNDELYYSPFFAHILEGWAKREHPNVLFLFYEDMKRNLRGEIVKVCTFLGKTLSEQQLELLTRHLHFDSVSKNTAINFMESKADSKEPCKFIRKGKTGDWKNHFNPELNARLDEWIRKNLEGSDLKFTMELDYQD